MEFWPEDKQGQGKSKRGGKRKEKVSPSGTSYLEPGRLEAVTLVENRSSFKWTSPFRTLTSPKLIPGDSIEVLGPTRPTAVYIPPTSIVHRAEQGANFLRTYFPDIDIAAELVREELSTDAQISRDLEQYNPFSGNVLELLHMPDDPNTRNFMAFPAGVTGSDLRILSSSSLEDTSSFEHSITPVKSFATPILQLVSSQTFLAARTFGSTILMSTRYIPDPPHVAFAKLSTITQKDTGQRSSVDVKFHSGKPDALFVNDEGSVYKCSIENGQVQSAYPGTKNSNGGNRFWQLASAGEDNDGCLLASSKVVQELDFRTDGLALNLLSFASHTSEKLTRVEDPCDNYLIPLASTERILWLDRRFPGKPLIGMKHRRNYDRTLALHTVTLRRSHHHLLTSRKNSLVTVYDVSRSTGQLLHVDNVPYSFSLNTPESRFSGEAYVNMGNQFRMFRISERGRITCLDLEQNDNDITTSVAPMQCLPAKTNYTQEMRPYLGPVGTREFSRTNLRPAYEQLFPSVVDIDRQEEKNAEAVSDLLAQLSSFWQQEDTPIEQVLTTYDILFRAGEEPVHPSRADILTETVFNSTRGYRILLQGRLPTQDLKDGASWHHDIAPILNHFDESTIGHIGTIAEGLRSFDLSRQPDDPFQASRRQSKAREQLALDLTLSRDIFSVAPFTQWLQHPASDYAKAGFPLHFHYLQPTPKRDYYSKEGHEEDDLNIPFGVKLLLEDWDVGVNPEEYVFNDPYNVGAGFHPEARAQGRTQFTQSQATPPPPSFLPQSQMPPSIAVVPVAQSLDLPLGFLTIERHSQVTEVESQPLMASTQVLPGPFGGRPAAVGKKKPVKKRMGGF